MASAAEKAIAKGATDVRIIGKRTIAGRPFEISQNETGFFAEALDNPSENIYILHEFDCDAQQDEDGNEYLPAIPYTLDSFIQRVEAKLSGSTTTRLSYGVRVPYPGC